MTWNKEGNKMVQQAQAQADPLPSWNDGASKRAIVEFVARVTPQGRPDFVPPAERIAVSDNDGTLWTEQPMYVQLAFALERVKVMATMHPEWANMQPLKAALEGDLQALGPNRPKRACCSWSWQPTPAWLRRNLQRSSRIGSPPLRHPRFGLAYTELLYRPLIELLAYLRANGFKTFIVSGGGIEFMRPSFERVYGVPAAGLVGSSIKTKFQIRDDGRPELFGLPEVNLINDNVGKPARINEFIGRPPIAAFGNSDSNLGILQWTTMTGGARSGLSSTTPTPEREYAYDRNTPFGRLDKALDAATLNKWTVVNMKNDWKTHLRV